MRNQNCFKQTITKSSEKLGWVALRGGLLGMCHLSVYQTVLDFIAQPLDPLGTKVADVDQLTEKFIFNQTEPKSTSS